MGIDRSDDQFLPNRSQNFFTNFFIHNFVMILIIFKNSNVVNRLMNDVGGYSGIKHIIFHPPQNHIACTNLIKIL